jgi:large subunit ribosomal protein L22
MGSRKQNSADKRKEARKTLYIAELNNCPTSPRKMSLVAELIQGKNVYQALNILHFSPKHAAKKMEKLLTSAISNFEQKTGERAEESNLFVKSVHVDGAAILKRFRPAPQGRAYRIRKRSNHVTLIVDKRLEEAQAATTAEVTDNNSAE